MTPPERQMGPLPTHITSGGRLLTATEFQGLAAVPPELEWFANIRNAKTKRAYRVDLQEFMAFVGIRAPEEFRQVTRMHVIAWRDTLTAQQKKPSTIRRKLSALASLFNYLCDQNAVTHNPVTGVARPNEGANIGKTPAISTREARALLDAPSDETLKGKRDRMILSILLFHGIRCEELYRLKVKDYHRREGVMFFLIHGKGSKIRFIPVAIETQLRIAAYVEAAGHGDQPESPLARPIKNNSTDEGLHKHLNPKSVYRDRGAVWHAGWHRSGRAWGFM